MNPQLQQAGVRFLKLLGRHSDVIMDAYLGGEVADGQLEEGVEERLKKEGILYRPEQGANLRLRKSVRTLLEEALKDERNRQIDTNLGSALAAIKTLAAHYKEARHSGDYGGAEAYLSDLAEAVYSFAETLRHDIRALWGRINNAFGYVGTINAKIRENELAQSQVSDLLAGLEMVNFQELADIAGDIRELRRLMVTSLQSTLSECTQELGMVQARLLELLGRFREIRGRTRLLKGWLLHQDQHPDYQVGNHAGHQALPQLFNQAEAILAPAWATVHNSQHEQMLIELVDQIKAQGLLERTTSQPQEALPLVMEEVDDFEVAPSPIKQAVDDYFIAVIDSGEEESALGYLARHQLPWDAESWLYQIINGYEGLAEEQRRHFELDPIGEPHPIYSGNFIIRDLSLWLA
ncbi:phosphoenolpyruvate carboxylase [Gallaecimonas pentaromativorans]|uniref:Phosphoenolpyruvate carboxylase n=1 Tax=Gallaecimonas pentaromativorans TaxID=584787 RepID=A0A3N1PUN6_9GAMM|nr:phosphoenolpyruvate carboxylase [Gallaecimonas pentaromativorans]ROQ30450.1 hypothetical protein EDC28_101136 [Gallaecimonas pentaromativorans]